ncbi:MAG: hypothetical protein ACSLEN_07015 [Candidatus Malihini olakiniferum]
MMLGVVETLASAYAGEGFHDLVAFSVLLVFLLFRPQGIAGNQRLSALGGGAAAALAMPSTSLLSSASSQRASNAAIELPSWGFLALAVVLSLSPVLTQGGYLLQAVVYAMIFALLIASVSLVAGVW